MTAARPYRVAVIGAGPAGFYATEALLRAPQGIAVDLYDRLPTPYGLVRFGVAPDHPKLKQVTKVFEGIAALPGFRFLGNVSIGFDVALDQLRRHYHAVIVACGAERDRPLGIPGASLGNVFGGMAFVGWYNGHPDRRDLNPDLSGRTAVVIGLGNVALDVARIIAKPAALLQPTDIAGHALRALYASNIYRIVVAARGGPATARCTEKELREFSAIPGCVASADSGNYGAPPEAGVSSLFDRFAASQVSEGRQCHFAFGLRPTALIGDERVRAVRFARSPIRDGEAQACDPDAGGRIEVEADIVISCIGSRATLIDGLPQAYGDGAVRHNEGRVLDGNRVVPGLYVSGWIKRGANGTIGTNRACSVETVASLLADLPHLSQPVADLNALAGGSSPIFRKSISFEQWGIIDKVEIDNGNKAGRIREKIVCTKSMLEECAFTATH